MLLTISTTHRPATDLGQLLHHDLDGIGTAVLPSGRALVCFSQADEVRCTAAVMLDAVSAGPSQLALALAHVFGRALHGRDGTAPELAGRPLPFEVALPVLPTCGGPALIRGLFEPLGYRVTIDPVSFDAPPPADHAPGEVAVELAAEVRAADLLSHLCVLLPVLDDARPDASDAGAAGGVLGEAGETGEAGEAGETALEWLLVEGDAWLRSHPAFASIARRYGRRQCSRTA